MEEMSWHKKFNKTKVHWIWEPGGGPAALACNKWMWMNTVYVDVYVCSCFPVHLFMIRCVIRQYQYSCTSLHDQSFPPIGFILIVVLCTTYARHGLIISVIFHTPPSLCPHKLFSCSCTYLCFNIFPPHMSPTHLLFIPCWLYLPFFDCLARSIMYPSCSILSFIYKWP